MTTCVCDNALRTTTVCIDHYREDSLFGRFYNPYMKNGGEFKSLMQLLLKMEQMHDAMEFPQSFTEKRSFADYPRLKTGPPATGFSHGKLATFAIKIIFRQNTSWQGSILWLEWGEEQSFRSVLELIYLMDNALKKTVKQAV